MEEFIHRENLIILKRRLAEAKNDAQRQMLAKLLAEEEAWDISTKRHGNRVQCMSVKVCAVPEKLPKRERNRC
jgi:hypothetical protein